ncbi:autotransporter outer membrane beta-barrel domain-containing protein [Mesorhizobium sp. Ld1326N3]|uniref:Autotransporter outer membrane beta-barrel domain-containing protein n=1 Tax=Mesorhizobium salmacidum TaxID=3015171 RepID=A0ABU8L5J1_9HYPH
MSSKWSLTPQAQLAYSDFRFDMFADKFVTVVSPGSGDSLVGRFGVSADCEDQWAGAAGQVSRTPLRHRQSLSRLLRRNRCRRVGREAGKSPSSKKVSHSGKPALRRPSRYMSRKEAEGSLDAEI